MQAATDCYKIDESSDSLMILTSDLKTYFSQTWDIFFIGVLSLFS
jgi:hypothetical protein